jgi:hypothetical protein
MSSVATLHIYSGPPDPSWLLSAEDADHFWRRVGALRDRTSLKAKGPGTFLGYRGFTVTEILSSTIREVRVMDGIVDLGSARASFLDSGRSLEISLLETAPGGRVGSHALSKIEKSLSRKFDELLQTRLARSVLTPPAAVCGPGLCMDAPKYDPCRWNYDPIQGTNTCYNYANNQVLPREAEPGGPPYSCYALLQGAMADGLLEATDITIPLGKGEGWYVAVATSIDPCDFHFLRQDENGCWSHKVGHEEATNLDLDCNVITDPAQAKLEDYTVCAYMITNCKAPID